MTLTKLTVTTAADFGNGKTSTFKALALPSGECVVPGHNTHDSWYASRDQIEACGADVVTGVEEDGEAEWTEDDIRESIAGSAREFGQEAVPTSLHGYLGQCAAADPAETYPASDLAEAAARYATTGTLPPVGEQIDYADCDDEQQLDEFRAALRHAGLRLEDDGSDYTVVRA